MFDFDVQTKSENKMSVFTFSHTNQSQLETVIEIFQYLIVF